MGVEGVGGGGGGYWRLEQWLKTLYGLGTKRLGLPNHVQTAAFIPCPLVILRVYSHDV